MVAAAASERLQAGIETAHGRFLLQTSSMPLTGSEIDRSACCRSTGGFGGSGDFREAGGGRCNDRTWKQSSRQHLSAFSQVNGRPLVAAETSERLAAGVVTPDGRFLLTGGTKGSVHLRWLHSLQVRCVHLSATRCVHNW